LVSSGPRGCGRRSACAVALLLNVLLVKRGAPGGLQGVLAFVGLSCAFFIASSGSPYYVWREVPFMFHVLSTTDSLIERLVLEGGFAGALAGAFGHWLLGRSSASAIRRPASWGHERWAFALSMTLVGAATRLALGCGRLTSRHAGGSRLRICRPACALAGNAPGALDGAGCVLGRRRAFGPGPAAGSVATHPGA
jgi:hypothetical protein